MADREKRLKGEAVEPGIVITRLQLQHLLDECFRRSAAMRAP